MGSVNSFINPELCKVSFSSFDNILDKIYECGKGAELAKVDIKSAFRLLIVNPSDFDLLGIYFVGKFYIDKCLPMGCAISCSLFEKSSTFLQWAVEEACGLHSVDHYLDDFLFVGQKDTNNGSCNGYIFLRFYDRHCSHDGSYTRREATQTKCIFKFLLQRKKFFLKDLESFIGLLSYCSRAIPSSRDFIRRFYDLIASVKVKKPYYMIRINKEVKADVLIWLKFLDSFNGQCYFPEKVWLSNEVLQLFTDSSGNSELGCGAYFNGRWAQCQWPSEWKNSFVLINLTLLELIPVVLALYLWAPHLKTKRILFNIDNMSLMSVVNKRTSKDKLVMKLLRPLVLLTMLNDVQFKAIHLSSSENSIADAISRFQLQRKWYKP